MVPFKLQERSTPYKNGGTWQKWQNKWQDNLPAEQNSLFPCISWRLPFLRRWTMCRIWPLRLMTSLLLLSGICWVPLRCWWECPQCLPWTCGLRLCCKPWVLIGTMRRCGLQVSCRLLNMWQLCPLVMLRSLRMVGIFTSSWCKLPRKVSYKCIFGAFNQGQTLARPQLWGGRCATSRQS